MICLCSEYFICTTPSQLMPWYKYQRLKFDLHIEIQCLKLGLEPCCLSIWAWPQPKLAKALKTKAAKSYEEIELDQEKSCSTFLKWIMLPWQKQPLFGRSLNSKHPAIEQGSPKSHLPLVRRGSQTTTMSFPCFTEGFKRRKEQLADGSWNGNQNCRKNGHRGSLWSLLSAVRYFRHKLTSYQFDHVEKIALNILSQKIVLVPLPGGCSGTTKCSHFTPWIAWK